MVASDMETSRPSMLKMALLALLAPSAAIRLDPAASSLLSRRAVCLLPPSLALALPLAAGAAVPANEAALLDEIRTCRKALDPIPGLLDEEKWDAVRSILKPPPVGNRALPRLEKHSSCLN